MEIRRAGLQGTKASIGTSECAPFGSHQTSCIIQLGRLVTSRLGNFIVFMLLLFGSIFRSGIAEGGPMS